jgi:hypothetical protein
MLNILGKLYFPGEICAIMPAKGQLGRIKRNPLEFKLEREVPTHLWTGEVKIAA